jgi:tetratricopeptide (TPR) repeat protein
LPTGLKDEHQLVQAWAAYAAGNSDDAVRQLRAVADDQDKVGKGETELPAREMLADMLLDLKRPQEALAEYEISLRTDPNRFNGLYGAAQAAPVHAVVRTQIDGFDESGLVKQGKQQEGTNGNRTRTRRKTKSRTQQRKRR